MAPSSSRGPATVYDTEVEVKANNLLDRLFSEAEQYRKRDCEGRWNLAQDYYKGNHWPDRKPDSYVPRVVANEIKKTVLQTLALLTDVKPRAEVVPGNISHSGDNFALWVEHSARVLKHIVEANWRNQSTTEELIQALLDVEIFFRGFLKVVWDPSLNAGFGDFATIRIDPRYMYIDPYTLRLEDSQYLCIRQPRPLSYIRRRWPLKGALVAADVGLSSWVKDSPKSFMHKIGLRRYRNQDMYEVSAIPKAWVEEWWIRDPSVDAEGRMKYPSWRVMTRASNVMLQDVANPYWDDELPIVDISAGPIVDTYWDESPVNTYMDLQDIINKFWSTALSNVQQHGNAQWIGDRDALTAEGWDALGDQPGGVVQVKPGRQLRREPPIPLPEWVLSTIDKAGGNMKEIAGLLDAANTKGASGGMTPGGFMDAMVLSLQAQIRFKARSMETAIEKIGWRQMSRALQFYEKRLLAYEGFDGWQTMMYDPEFLVPNVEGLSRENLVRWAIKRYQYKVTPGSSLSLSREKQWAVSAALFGMQAIDKEALLQDVEYPRREEVLQRMKVAEEKQAMLAQMAGGGKPPAGQKGPAAAAKPVKSRSAVSSIVKGLMKSATG